MASPVEDLFGEGKHVDEALYEVPGRPTYTKHSVAQRTVTDNDVRCSAEVPSRLEPGTTHPCNRLLAEFVGRPWRIRCPRCKTLNVSPA